MNRLVREFCELLHKNGFYYDEEYVKSYVNTVDEMEITGKAYGDSHEEYTDDYFGKDFPRLEALAKELGFELPEYIWFD